MPAPGQQECRRRSARTPSDDRDLLSPPRVHSLRTTAHDTVSATAASRGTWGDDGPVNFLQGLHGAVALALLPALLFAEEAGVPLPFAPGELTLLVAGLLIASGGLNPYAFIPLALIACIAGSLVGYSWARAVGDRGLKGLARRLRQQRNLERVEDRLRSAGWRGIAISRLIPGIAHLHDARGRSGASPASIVHLAMGVLHRHLGRRRTWRSAS